VLRGHNIHFKKNVLRKYTHVDTGLLPEEWNGASDLKKACCALIYNAKRDYLRKSKGK
jgi:hypothetical protein